MPDYRFIFEGGQDIAGSAGISNIPSSNISTSSDEQSKFRQFGGGFGNRVQNTVISQSLSPLNSATGGLATPAYRLGSQVVSGASAGAIGGTIATIAIKGIQLAVSAIQNRIAKLEEQANELNERDNVLIRAGAKTEATFYTSNFWGVREVDRSR